MINIEHLDRDLENIRKNSPLIHNITNYVVMNNTANALLAIGASPVMAHALEEVEEMTLIASSLVLNIGTLDNVWIKSMLLAGKTALKNNTPIVFDPVGAGATSYRTKICLQLIKECKPSIVRGNASEIIALMSNLKGETKGVDSVTPAEMAIASAKSLAAQSGAIVVISGQTDYITDGIYIETVANGSPLMSKVTGMGCTATAITGAFAAVNPNMYEAAIHAMTVMGIAGELASKKAEGNGSMQIYFLDELFKLDRDTLKNNIKY